MPGLMDLTQKDRDMIRYEVLASQYENSSTPRNPLRYTDDFYTIQDLMGRDRGLGDSSASDAMELREKKKREAREKVEKEELDYHSRNLMYAPMFKEYHGKPMMPSRRRTEASEKQIRGLMNLEVFGDQ